MGKHHLRWMVDRRSKIQLTLFELLQIQETHGTGETIEDDPWHTLARMNAIAFSLWRSVFLASGAKPNKVEQHSHRLEFLRKVISDNTISYFDDKKMHSFSSLFYNNNARYLLESQLKHHQDFLKLREFQEIVHLREVDTEEMEPYKFWDINYAALTACIAYSKKKWPQTFRTKNTKSAQRRPSTSSTARPSNRS